eukprot:5261422-Amphidinium_carterae.1
MENKNLESQVRRLPEEVEASNRKAQVSVAAVTIEAQLNVVAMSARLASAEQALCDKYSALHGEARSVQGSVQMQHMELLVNLNL